MDFLTANSEAQLQDRTLRKLIGISKARLLSVRSYVRNVADGVRHLYWNFFWGKPTSLEENLAYCEGFSAAVELHSFARLPNAYWHPLLRARFEEGEDDARRVDCEYAAADYQDIALDCHASGEICNRSYDVAMARMSMPTIPHDSEALL